MAGQDAALEALKARMSPDQIREMAEIVSAEVKRREAMKSNGSAKTAVKSGVKSSRIGNALERDDLRDMYSDVRDRVGQIKARQAGGGARGRAPKISFPGLPRLRLPKIRAKNALLAIVIGGFATAKVLLSTGAINSDGKLAAEDPQSRASLALNAPIDPTKLDVSHPLPSTPEVAHESSARQAPDRRVVGWSMAEKQVLTELDARRVELERKRQLLDEREADLKQQSAVLQERVAELRTLSAQVNQVRKESDNEYESRMDQLATVYVSMAPNEAAPLMAKLDDQIALALLKRMPGKRMGQILSVMDQDRAVLLTRILSDRKS